MNPTTNNLVSQVQPLIDFLKKQQENEKFYKSLENIATIVLITFFLVFALRPTALTISALVGEIKSKEILQKQMKQKINDVIQAQDTFSQVQERYLVVNSSLPDSPRYATIVSQLQSLATAAGFSFDQVNFNLRQDDQTGALNSYTIQVSSSLPFTSATSLLEQISRLRRLLKLDQVSFSPVEATSEPSSSSAIPVSGSVNLNLSSKVFYWQN